ncbi:MAG: aldehyde dehydrogenase (NADP(+)), partial [Actinomycetota bacterium]
MTRVITVDAACAAAHAAAPAVAASDLTTRAGWLEAMADALDAARDDLVPIAVEESRLGVDRLTGEVGRMTGQLRLMAQVVREGSFLGIVLDKALPDITPPRPDLRRMNVPLGPVAVFSASNFPFAFATIGGDTASALASGCPVVVKPNPGHPRLADAVMAVAQDALAVAGVPAGMLTMVSHELQPGIDLVNDDRIEAVAFTGSPRGGLALARLAADRPRPIPFFGELGSINPIFVTADAARERGAVIAEGWVGSFTLGAGQFCTKPGLLIAPRDETLRAAAVAATEAVGGQGMLTPAIRDTYLHGLGERVDSSSVSVLSPGGWDESTDTVRPTLVAVDIDAVIADESLLEECFGPTSILVEYADEKQMLDLADALPGLLAAGVQGQGGEPIVAELMPRLVAHAGRVLWNGWPTGVAVTWSMQHGGPFPATTAPATTSVGAAAVERFLRPV